MRYFFFSFSYTNHTVGSWSYACYGMVLLTDVKAAIAEKWDFDINNIVITSMFEFKSESDFNTFTK